eukprot:15448285-Alexandrium_andersonii.AAC.1
MKRKHAALLRGFLALQNAFLNYDSQSSVVQGLLQSSTTQEAQVAVTEMIAGIVWQELSNDALA